MRHHIDLLRFIHIDESIPTAMTVLLLGYIFAVSIYYLAFHCIALIIISISLHVRSKHDYSFVITIVYLLSLDALAFNASTYSCETIKCSFFRPCLDNNNICH